LADFVVVLNKLLLGGYRIKLLESNGEYNTYLVSGAEGENKVQLPQNYLEEIRREAFILNSELARYDVTLPLSVYLLLLWRKLGPAFPALVVAYNIVTRPSEYGVVIEKRENGYWVKPLKG
jgi:hypothetical protein